MFMNGPLTRGFPRGVLMLTDANLCVIWCLSDNGHMFSLLDILSDGCQIMDRRLTDSYQVFMGSRI